MSRENARLKLARRVRDGRENDSVFVEGIRLAEEALRSDLRVRECFMTSKALKNERNRIMGAAVIGSGAKIHEISQEIFRSVSDTENPQGILLICDKPKGNKRTFESALRFSTERIPVVVFLAEANNPSNLGAIVRTAEAAGVPGVMVSKRSADPYSSKSLRASMGSAFRLPIWVETELSRAVDWARERGLIITAADIGGDKVYTNIDWRIPRLLVFGSEAHGLSEADKKKIDDLITIPIDPSVESLNLAIAAGVLLFEANRQIKLQC